MKKHILTVLLCVAMLVSYILPCVYAVGEDGTEGALTTVADDVYISTTAESEDTSAPFVPDFAFLNGTHVSETTGIATLETPSPVVNGASTGTTPELMAIDHYNSFIKLATLEVSSDSDIISNHPSMQGIAVGSGYLYSVKIADNTSACIYRTSQTTGETVAVTNSATNTKIFSNLGHANDMESWGSYLYVTTAGDGEHDIVRFELNNQSSSSTATQVATYDVHYNGKDIDVVSGFSIVGSSGNDITILAKNAEHIYRGTIPVTPTSGNTVIDLELLCVLDRSKTYINGTLTDLSAYTTQGMGYDQRTGKLYVPYSANDIAGKGNQSAIAVYDISNVSGGVTVTPVKNESFYFTSATDDALFEIESCDVGSADGRLYFNTNGRQYKSNSTDYTTTDGIYYVEDFMTDGYGGRAGTLIISHGSTQVAALDSNSEITWYAGTDGTSTSQYHTSSEVITVSGMGILNILIKKNPGSTNDNIRLNQLVVDGDVTVNIVVEDGILNSPYILANSSELFVVKDGSLSMSGPANGKTLNLNGNSGRIIHLGTNARSLDLDRVYFYSCDYGAISCASNTLSRLQVENCTFASSINTSAVSSGAATHHSGNGAAIYVEPATSGDVAVDVCQFIVKNCKFNQNVSNGYFGGAIALMGRIHTGQIWKSQFNGCKTQSYNSGGGGAIALAGDIGKFSIVGCTMDACSTTGDGGAIHIASLKQTENGRPYRYCRINELTIDGCDIKNCTATHSEKLNCFGGGIFIKAQTHTLNVFATTFDNCVSDLRGGAICVENVDLADNFYDSTQENYESWGTPSYNASCGCVIGSSAGGLSGWETDSTGTITGTKVSKMVNLNISGSYIRNCAAERGGAIFLGDYVQIEKLNITGAKTPGDFTANASATADTDVNKNDYTIYNCTADRAGSAIFLNADGGVKNMVLTNVSIGWCTVTGTVEGDYGGTIKTCGGSSIALTMNYCTLKHNKANGSGHNGGGLYWNANNGYYAANGKCSAVISNCQFAYNYANDYGGGIYCESDMTISACNIFGNEAGNLGGGIAQQVYNNDVFTLPSGGMSELKLDPNTWIHDNKATYGGGISIRANATVSIPDVSQDDSTTDFDETTFTYSVRFDLNGAAIYNNTATTHGGGIYFKEEDYTEGSKNAAQVAMYTKEIYIQDGGEKVDGTLAYGAVYANSCGNSGGGIYMKSSDDTSLYVENGYISSNKAAVGGGIYLLGKNATCYVKGGIIGGVPAVDELTGQTLAMGNEAFELSSSSNGGWGGGIAIDGGAKIEMTGGEVSYNFVTGDGKNNDNLQGGGIWLKDGDSSTYNTMVISDGTIKNNSTPGGTNSNGGGVYVGSKNSFTMENGDILNNSSGTGWGGGVACNESSTVTIRGGSVSGNTAGAGGGLFGYNSVHFYIYGGSITNNTATGNGGGIFGQYYPRVTMSGGDISGNRAGSNGGGICGYNPYFTIQGGSISDNVAGGFGGGLYVERTNGIRYCNIEATENSIPCIENNTAACGGGVYSTGGVSVKLSDGGYVINNRAVGTPTSTVTTAYQLNNTLKGVGGGIYVADSSSFTLTGDTMAIYGNLADFAADDVFANGNNTDLNVPSVANMTLDGYGMKALGWYEDYPISDTYYDQRLGYETSAQASGENVRYRGSLVSQRVLVTVGENDTTTAGEANKAGVYVCMTLGAPGTAPDSVVIDFGLNVKVDVLSNEDNSKTSSAFGFNFGTTKPSLYVGPYRSSGDSADSTTVLAEGFGPSLTTTYGKVTANADGTLTYTPNTTNMNTVDRFSYAFEYTTEGSANYFYGTVTIIPATNIYYEDGFLTFTDSTATSGDFGKWTTVGTSGSGTQGQDAPGVEAALGSLDSNDIYGFDPAYGSYTTFSLGSAHKVTVDMATGAKDVAPTASFTFTGTGFDVVSLTDSTSGCITVTVTNKQSGATVANYLVSNYYGYKFENDQWVPSASSDVLYQVPVMKISGLDYDTYDVVIRAAYLPFMDILNAGSYSIWIDAVRVYGPAGGDADANDAYVKDNEQNPTYTTIRDLVVGQENFTAGSTDITGTVFIDGKGVNDVSITDYANQGPNNELYLKNGQGIAFKLISTTPQADGAPLAVHIGAKLAMGDKVQLNYNGEELAVLQTATNMFYALQDVTWTWDSTNGYWVSEPIVLSCANAGSNILSLTDVKITSKSPAALVASVAEDASEVIARSASPVMLLVADGPTAEYAMQVMELYFAQPDVPVEDPEDIPKTEDSLLLWFVFIAVATMGVLLTVPARAMRKEER